MDELLPKATGHAAKIEKKKARAEQRRERELSPGTTYAIFSDCFFNNFFRYKWLHFDGKQVMLFKWTAMIMRVMDDCVHVVLISKWQ